MISGRYRSFTYEDISKPHIKKITIWKEFNKIE
jgi:hypothetical protein